MVCACEGKLLGDAIRPVSTAQCGTSTECDFFNLRFNSAAHSIIQAIALTFIGYVCRTKTFPPERAL